MAVTTAVLWGGNTFIIEHRMNNTNGNMYTLKPIGLKVDRVYAVSGVAHERSMVRVTKCRSRG